MKRCDECKTKEATRHYVLGTKRCDPCSARFDFQNWKRRYLLKNAEHICEDCNNKWIGQYGCPVCCEHEPDPDEGYHCLSCGKDCSADVAAEAYDRWKDYRKYGH